MRAFRRGALQEFPSGGDIEKKIVDFDDRPRRCARRTDVDFFPPLDDDARAFAIFRVRVTRVSLLTDAMLGSASPRNPKDVSCIKSSTPLFCWWRDVRVRAPRRLRHPVAVVGDDDVRHASLRDVHANTRRTGIERISDQLLDDARGRIDDFTRRDLVRKIVGEFFDLAHEPRSRLWGAGQFEDAAASLASKKSRVPRR